MLLSAWHLHGSYWVSTMHRVVSNLESNHCSRGSQTYRRCRQTEYCRSSLSRIKAVFLIGVEKTFKIVMSNHQPGLLSPITELWPLVPCPHGSEIPPGMVTPTSLDPLFQCLTTLSKGGQTKHKKAHRFRALSCNFVLLKVSIKVKGRHRCH